MSQMDRLPKIKRIELTARQMRPPEGAKAVGTMDDGTVIYEGPIFAGNPWFKNHSDPEEARDNGHVRTPVMDPISGEPKWKKNNRGDAITQVFRNKRRMKLCRFIMSDDGNGSAGPRPVPGMTAEEREHREHESNRSSYQDAFFAAAQAEGIPAADLVKRLAALNAEEPEAPKAKRGRPPKEVSVDG